MAWPVPAGTGQAVGDQVGAVPDLLQLALYDADQAGQVGGGFFRRKGRVYIFRI